MNDSKFGFGLAKWRQYKSGLRNWGWRGDENRSTGNHGTSENSSSHSTLEGIDGRYSWNKSGSLFQYLTTRIEKDDFLRRHWLGPCRTLKGWPLKPGRTGVIYKRPGSRSYPPENSLHTAISPPRSWRLCKECKPSRRSGFLNGSRRNTFTSLGANRWISTKQSASPSRFGEQACIAYSRWDLTNVSWRGANADSDSSTNDRLIINSIHLALEAASVSCRSLTTLATRNSNGKR